MKNFRLGQNQVGTITFTMAKKRNKDDKTKFNTYKRKCISKW